MYAHPSFIRDRVDLLSYLRKCPTSSRRKVSSTVVVSDDSSSSSSGSGSVLTSKRHSDPKKRRAQTKQKNAILAPASVLDASTLYSATSTTAPASGMILAFENATHQRWLSYQNTASSLTNNSTYIPKSASRNDSGLGRLELLALAVQHASF
jgi:hypothetical protein